MCLERYPVSIIVGPDSLLHGAELAGAERLADDDVLVRDDMFAGHAAGRRAAVAVVRAPRTHRSVAQLSTPRAQYLCKNNGTGLLQFHGHIFMDLKKLGSNTSGQSGSRLSSFLFSGIREFQVEFWYISRRVQPL